MDQESILILKRIKSIKVILMDQHSILTLHEAASDIFCPPIKNILELGVQPKKYHFCILLAWQAETHVLHQKFEKKTQNVPKFVDNHWW